MKVAALDLGSNTFLCLICEVQNNLITEIFEDCVEIVRLGQGLSESKKFHPDALLRADKTLTKFSEIIKKHNPDRILAMATAAARDVENAEELFKICQKHSIPIEIIPGNQEAQITFSGATSNSDDLNQKLVVIDIGGGSTEYIFGVQGQIEHAQSFNIGCVKLTEKYFSKPAISPADVQSCILEIQSSLNQLPYFSPSSVLAVAGTPTTLAAAEIGSFIVKKIDGYKFTLNQLEIWKEKLIPATLQEKIKMGLPEGRADVMLVGVLILIESLKKFQKNGMIVSTRGVRYGVALEVARRFSN